MGLLVRFSVTSDVVVTPEANEAMISMLSYRSNQEPLSLEIGCNPIQDPNRRAQLLAQRDADALVDTIEIEWKRKDHAITKFAGISPWRNGRPACAF